MKLLFLLLMLFANTAVAQNIFIPIAGNTWVVNNTDDKINHKGIQKWQDNKSILTTYFKTSEIGEIEVALLGKVATGSSSLRIDLDKQEYTVNISNTVVDTIHVGKFNITRAGYQELHIQGISKSAADFAHIEGILISGPAANEIIFVKDDFYWGRRGPSVHLRYDIPNEADDIVWFYNEITVPEGEDVVGSYFMANGFAEGYFGIQVNSTEERRILFSVWSPYKTDDPKSIPQEYRIKLLGKGENVHAGKFGNEGSGGQSYLRYMWRAGNTYRFLLKGVPSENNSTDFTAFFYAPELNKWLLIASFRRPKTSTYLKRPHSFLENFVTETGYISRKLYYSNQWVCDASNKWHELTTATFTADATARKGARMDYFGGTNDKTFFLQNCGFINKSLEIGSELVRKPSAIPPQIDFSRLPK